MLKFQRLEIEDFGPFKDIQSLEFPKDDGVSIVYGENMRGKTSLLNAIRYTLFGVVRNRKYEKEDLFKFSNLESGKVGKYGFRLALFFSSNGSEYELHRSLVPKKGINNISSNKDFDEECFIRKDGITIGPDSLAIEIEQIMPEQVSRFFLFDGELLQEYEDLLSDESQMGRRISAAIERILGIPILTNARDDLYSLISAAEKDLSNAALLDNQTQEIGQQLARLAETEIHHKKELDRLKKDHNDLEAEKRNIRHELGQLEEINRTLTEIEALEERIKAIDNELEEKSKKIQTLMANGWFEVIGEKVRSMREELQAKIEMLQSKRINKAILKHTKDKATEGLDKNECPTCRQILDEKAKRLLEKSIEECNSNLTYDESDAIYELTNAAEVLRSFEAQHISANLQEIIDEYEGLMVEKEYKKERVKNLKDDISSDSQERAKELNKMFENAISELAIVSNGIEAEENAANEIRESIKDLQDKLGEISGSNLTREKNKVNMYRNLHKLFESTVGKYRDELRKKVEKDSTDIFKQLTTEPEYEKLQINKSYGLKIIHEDGEEIPVRSAGAEQIVALSLIGALQKNAPLQGPIIMDSTFNRLDSEHTLKVIQALPGMAKQVLLLVHSSELNPEDAREELKGKLRSEYKLERISARHTMLKRVV